MEKAMLFRTTLIAVAMTITTSAFAEPPKVDASQTAQVQATRHEVVLASADTVPASSPAAVQPNPAPIKRTIPRVTTCRCGDPQPDPDSQDQ
jgi:hypothetical protein